MVERYKVQEQPNGTTSGCWEELACLEILKIPQINIGPAYPFMTFCTDSECWSECRRLPRVALPLTNRETKPPDRNEALSAVTLLSRSTTVTLTQLAELVVFCSSPFHHFSAPPSLISMLHRESFNWHVTKCRFLGSWSIGLSTYHHPILRWTCFCNKSENCAIVTSGLWTLFCQMTS